jgi:hypothetical protein
MPGGTAGHGRPAAGARIGPPAPERRLVAGFARRNQCRVGSASRPGGASAALSRFQIGAPPPEAPPTSKWNDAVRDGQRTRPRVPPATPRRGPATLDEAGVDAICGCPRGVAGDSARRRTGHAETPAGRQACAPKHKERVEPGLLDCSPRPRPSCHRLSLWRTAPAPAFPNFRCRGAARPSGRRAADTSVKQWFEPSQGLPPPRARAMGTKTHRARRS